jgi:hypothetical protein
MARPASMKKNVLKLSASILLLSAFTARVRSQDTGSLLDLVKDSAVTEYVNNAFKSTRIINGQSIEMLGKGSLDFRILHRFGLINGGPSNFFGLDESNVRLAFDYAVFNDLLIGIGRSSKGQKEIDGFVKYRLLHQSTGATVMPLSVVLLSGFTMATTAFDDETVANYFTSRLGFFHQILLGRKFGSLFSLQLSPTLVHRNIVPLTNDPHDIYALGVGGRISLTNRISFTFDWYHPFNGMTTANTDPLAIGFDIETGGHVFQVHLTNTLGMNERSFITETTDNWLKGGIRLGFNISRVFQIL